MHNNQINNSRADGHCYSFAWFNDLRCFEVYENIYPKGSQPARIYGLPKCTKILDLTQLRHFAPSCLLLEPTIITWPNIYAIFWRRTSQLNTVLQTLLLLYRTFNLYLCLVNLWFPSMLKVSLLTYLLRNVLTWRQLHFRVQSWPQVK